MMYFPITAYFILIFVRIIIFILNNLFIDFIISIAVCIFFA